MFELHFLFSVAIIIAFSFDHCNAGIPRNDGLHDISGFDLRDGRTGGARVAITPEFPRPPQYLPVQIQAGEARALPIFSTFQRPCRIYLRTHGLFPS